MRSWHSLAVGALFVACARAPESKSLRSDTAHGDVSSNQSDDVAYTAVDSIFRAHCVNCHSGTKPAHGVDLSSYERVMRGRDGHGPIVAVGNPAGSVLIGVLRGAGALKNDPSAHAAAVGQFPAPALATIANWIGSGAQPVGTDKERLTATLRLYVVALADAENGFYSWRNRYTTSFDSLRVIPVAGVNISFAYADTGRWEARITHPQLAETCIVGGKAGAPTRRLELATAAQFCSPAR